MSRIEGINAAVVLLVDLDSDPNRPDFFKFERRLQTNQFSFFPGPLGLYSMKLVRQTFVEWATQKMRFVLLIYPALCLLG